MAGGGAAFRLRVVLGLLRVEHESYVRCRILERISDGVRKDRREAELLVGTCRQRTSPDKAGANQRAETRVCAQKTVQRVAAPALLLQSAPTRFLIVSVICGARTLTSEVTVDEVRT